MIPITRCIITKLQSDINGSIAITFAGSLFLLLMVTGIAIDSLRWQMAIHRTQSAIDSAVLAAGRALQSPEATTSSVIETARTFYTNNETAHLISNVVQFEIVEDSAKIRGSSEGSEINTTFLNLLGIDRLPVDVTSTAALDVRDTEISMMLDITGSMGSNGKLESLQIASKSLIDKVLNDSLFENRTRAALVPFSNFVNIDIQYFKSATNEDPPGTGSEFTCVAERDNLNRYTDEPPTSGGYFTHMGNYYTYDPSQICPTVTAIMPLSDNKEALYAHIDSFATRPSSTAGHIGTAWSWYVLSPKWRDFWPDDHKPAYAEQDKVRKVAILMTDGDYNSQYSGQRSRAQAVELCNNMKDEDIIIYAVGFDINETSTAALTLKECATIPTSYHYYRAADGNALKAAYDDIADKLFSLRLSE